MTEIIEQQTTKKEEKLSELTNLIAQYNAGERENINADEYTTWVEVFEMLKKADIDEAIFDEFIANPEQYKITEGVIVYNNNWQAEAEAKENLRIANLHITKLDFFNNFCKPAGISIEVLESKILELGMEADWKYCNHIYYGVIKPFLNSLPLGKTEAEIIAIFESLCNDRN